MAHETPSYYRYVSSITINNGGTGYDSASPPAITITGGGGTGATATATVVGGTITDVTVTNKGNGYTSTPIVIVAGSSGGGAVLTAVVSFAGATPSSFTKNSSPNIKWTLPDFIRTDYAGTTSFVTFLEKYYESLDQTDSPLNILLNKRYFDIDNADSDELDKWAKELAHNFPKTTEFDRLTLYKYLKSIYESKGSKRSIEAFFKIVYNEDVEVSFPSQYVLRASDGEWVEEKSVRAFSGYNEYEVLNINATNIDVVYYQTAGSITYATRIPTSVRNVAKISYTAPQAYEVFLDLDRSITEIKGPGAQGSATIIVDSSGSVTGFNIINGGYQYDAAPTVQLFDDNASPGSGFEGRVEVSNGAITGVVITDGGSGYNVADTTVVFDTEDVRTFIIDRDAPLAASNVRAYLTRTLSSVTSKTYSGANAGFQIGNVYVINESGDDGLGYALDYFAEDYVFIGGGNNAIIRVTSIDSSNVPTAWEIINPGAGFTKATTDISILSSTGESLDITLNTNYLYQPTGKYKNDRGKLSDVNKLQDNMKWQSYSYIVKSTQPKTAWETAFKEAAHIAGMEVFGDLVLTAELDYSTTIGVVSEGLRINYFEFDEVSIDDTSIVFNFDKILSESATASETHIKSIGKSLSDSTENTANGDVGGQTYFAEDYVDNEYYVREEGFFIDYNKTLTDTATISELISPVTTWNRSFTETATVSDVPATQLTILRSPSDTATVSDVLVTTNNTFSSFSDSASSSESIDNFNFGKIISDTASATQSITSINTNKVLTDTASATEADAKDFSKSLSDSASVTDPVVIAMGNVFADSTSSIDDATIEFGISIVKTETLSATQTVVINTDKTASDTASATEADAKDFSTSKSDSATTSDSGTITAPQDYVDVTYFAEDYVTGNTLGTF